MHIKSGIMELRVWPCCVHPATASPQLAALETALAALCNTCTGPLQSVTNFSEFLAQENSNLNKLPPLGPRPDPPPPPI
jgi:hypothetical protein